MLKNIFGQLGALWRQIEEVGAGHDPTILVVTTFSSIQLDLRIFAIQEGWRLLFAKSLDDALQLRKHNRIVVVLYDRDLPDADWRRALRSLVTGDPVFFILLSPFVDRRLWKSVLDSGGYDVARTPLERQTLVSLVKGAFALASSVDSVVTV